MNHPFTLSPLVCVAILWPLALVGCKQEEPKQFRVVPPREVANAKYVDPALLTPFAQPLTTYVRSVEIDRALFEKHRSFYAVDPSMKGMPEYDTKLKKALTDAGYAVVDDIGEAQILVECFFRTDWTPHTSNTSFLWFYYLPRKCLLTKIEVPNYVLEKETEFIRFNSQKVNMIPDPVEGLAAYDLRMKRGKADVPIHVFLPGSNYRGIFRPDVEKPGARVFLGRPAIQSSKRTSVTDFVFEVDSVSHHVLRQIVHDLNCELAMSEEDADIRIEVALKAATFGHFEDARFADIPGIPLAKTNPGYDLQETLIIKPNKSKKEVQTVVLAGKTPERFKMPDSPLSVAMGQMREQLSARQTDIKSALKSCIDNP